MNSIEILEKKSVKIYRDLIDVLNGFKSISSKLEKNNDVFDESTFVYTDSFEFDANEKIVSDLNFNISGDSVFIAKRFGLYLRRRINDSAKVVNSGILPDGVFESCGFNFQLRPVFENTVSVDCLFQLSESYKDKNGNQKTREYQNMPIPVSMSYSGNNNVTGSPSCKIFENDWEIQKNSTVQCKVTVTSSLMNNNDLSIPDRFKIIGILSGIKRTKKVR